MVIFTTKRVPPQWNKQSEAPFAGRSTKPEQRSSPQCPGSLPLLLFAVLATAIISAVRQKPLICEQCVFFVCLFVCMFKPPQRSPGEMLVPQVNSVSFASGHTNTYWLHCPSWHAGPMSHAFPRSIHTICPSGLKFLVGSQLWLFSLLFWFPSLELYFALVDSQASFPTQQAALKVLRAPTHCVLHFANKYIWWCYNSK